MSVSNLEEELDLYKTQLGQVEQALAASGEIDELLKLKKDLQELIQLTEESLLSVKKESILRSSENSNSVQENIDEEYAAFQAALSEDITPSASLSTASQDVDNDSQSEIQDKSDDDNNDVLDLCSKFEELVGMKCCAPYSQEWGSFSYHNAIVSGILKVDHAEVPQLSVVFCHPTQRSMVPCPYFLEDTCKYDSDKCRFSHGHAVKLEDIKEYVEPDYSLLLLESKCLCRYEDDVWYKATVVDIHENNNYSVIFDEYGHDVHDISIPDIIPCIHDSNENDSDADDHSDEVESDEEDQDLPVYLYNPSSSCVQMGEWENHTKGIASKLMAKMGYNVGEGLGKNSQGKTEPVPILLLPQGKSLDKIMELKEKAGNQDLYDVMKRHDKQKKKALEKSEKAYQAVGPETKDVFDFINHKLANKRGNLKDLIHKEHLRTSNPKISKNHKQISEADLKSKSDRSLNIQLYKTDEEKKNVRKEIERLKVSLSRNEQRDKKMAAQIRQKISNMENYLQQLESSQQAIHSHQEKRSGHKKLTVF